MLDSELNILLGENVIIYLQNKITIKGILYGFDKFMNLVINKTIFFINNEFEHRGITIVRGNQIVAIEKFVEI